MPGGDHFDVVVIGAGPAGENVAARAAAGGLTAAIVERELVGGECSYWACMPSKALLRPPEALTRARGVPGSREAARAAMDVPAALAWRDSKASHWDDSGQVDWLADAGIELVRGHGRLDGPRRVVVASEGGERELVAERAVVVATGSRAAIPPIEGIRDVEHWDNRSATVADAVPESLIVLGGGPVGVELGQAWRRLGCKDVTLIEREPRLLPAEEPVVDERVREALADDGVRVLVGAEVSRVERAGEGVRATLADGSTLAARHLLVATGRAPNTDDLGLDTVGLTPGEEIHVDDRLRAVEAEGTWLHAVGDVNGRNLLTHMGKYQARAAADVILGKDAAASSDATAAPRIVFCDPQVGAVGATEASAREDGIDAGVATVEGGVAATGLVGEGARHDARLIVDRSRGVAIGATFVGPHASELVHAATVAVVSEVPLEMLWHAVPAFPTVSEVWLRLLEDWGL